MNTPNFGAIFRGLQAAFAPAPAPAPPTSRAALTPAQAAARYGGAVPPSPENFREVYIIQQNDTVEFAFAHIELVWGWVYCCGGVSGGVLSAASAATYIGRTPQHLPTVRGVGDESIEYIIPERYDSSLQNARIYIRGAAGTNIVLIGRR